MKAFILAAAMLALSCYAASAQMWECTSNGAQCSPGSPNCSCVQVRAAPTPPSCPVGSQWNGSTCVMLPQVTLPMAPVAPACPAGTVWNGYSCQIMSVPIAPSPYNNPWYWHHLHELEQHQQ